LARFSSIFFRFGSVFSVFSVRFGFFGSKLKKLKPNQNWFKLTSFGSIRFGFLEQKPVPTGLARFSSVFFRFGLVFSVWLGFFCFFGSRLKKPNWTDQFFQNFNQFFLRFDFFSYFFSGFLDLISFLVFFNIPTADITS
jgi:hypothetical protein